MAIASSGTSRTLVTVIKAKDAYSQQLTKAGKLFKSFGKKIGTAIKAGALIAVAAIAGLTLAFVKFTKAANEQEAAEKKLATSLGFVSQALLDQASALQKQTTFGDEAIIKGQALIASFVKEEDQIKAATVATLDLAAAKGMDLTAAADLVSKTLGSSTNALARYGIQVEGAVGSTERLESLTVAIAEVFGGQAAAEAETFGGKMQQLSNAIGDVWEQLGFLITQNSFFISAVEAALGVAERWGAVLQDNRKELILLTKEGLVAVVKGVKLLTDGVFFAVKAWKGFKVVANGAISSVAEGIAAFLPVQRAMLFQFDALFEALVALGQIEKNPFDRLAEGLETFKASSKDVLSDSVREFDAFESTANSVSMALDMGIKTLEAMNATQIESTKITTANTAAILEQVKAIEKVAEVTAAAVVVDQGANDQQVVAFKAHQENILTAQREFNSLMAEVNAESTTGEGGDLVAIQASYDARLAAFVDFENRILQAAIDAGVQGENFATLLASLQSQRLKEEEDAAKESWNSRLGAASNFFSNLSTIAGSEGGKLFEISKAFAIAEATIAGITATIHAYSEGNKLGGPVLGAVFAATAAAQAGALVAQIASTEPGGSGSISVSGSTVTETTETPEETTTTTTTTQDVTVTLNYSSLVQPDEEEMAEQLVDIINSAADLNVTFNANLIDTTAVA